MPDQQPLTVEEWQAFLTEFSRRVLTSPEQTVDRFDPTTELGFVTVPRFSPEVLEKSWLGSDPCSESDIAAAEARLGRALPSRFRNFYLVSNGWTDAGRYGEDVWPIEKIDWLRNADPELVEVWLEVYDEDEATILKTSLLIGYADGGAGDYWLLKPPSTDTDSEWTAYQWGPGSAGDPEPYENFAVLMSEYFDEVVVEG
ncbi:hypothetical protein GCM10022223_26060 [Kineosporia mesophila]|uniref:Knr4/Smi1-like domain-containing protein n=1 Tax=Kineosporia mesophila TaxID=566012 RepID=A0ABP6ZIP8_9ACTN|nr:SMI1/KNR4 family protein [Kineosporia mesophila]MCD5350509.1 SMI1/KNR4 family protein [Kineosporia mesophila]